MPSFAIHLVQSCNPFVRLFQFFASSGEATLGQKHEEEWCHVDEIGGIDTISAFDKVIGESGLRRNLRADLDAIKVVVRCLIGLGKWQIAREYTWFNA